MSVEEQRAEFLTELKKNEGSEDTVFCQSDFVYHYFNEKLNDGEIELVRKIFVDFPVDEFDDSTLVYILCITLCAHDILPERNEFFYKVRDRLIDKLGEKETSRILHGLIIHALVS